MSAVLYATPEALREALKMPEEILSDADATELLDSACDLVDDRLGSWPIDEDTGRKIVLDDIKPWQAEKLAKATIEVAKVVFSDPGITSRQRVRSVSGDVATSSPYGAAYGELFEVLISASGLARKFARVSRRGRASRILDNFNRDLR